MTEYFGVIVKKIREDKGFMMKEIYSNILSRSTAYRFEKDAANITFNQFREILGRLNIFSIDEFTFLRRTYFNAALNEDAVLIEYENVMAERSNNLAQTGTLALDFYQKYKDSPQKQTKYYAYLVHVDYLITNAEMDEQVVDSILLYQDEFKFIKQRLLDVSKWTMAELEVFPIVSSGFGDDAKNLLYLRFKVNFKRYETFLGQDNWENKYVKLLLYYFIGQIYAKNYQEVANNLKDLDELYTNNQQLRLNNTLNYCLYLFVSGIRAAYLQAKDDAQAYYHQFVTIYQAVDPKSVILNYYHSFFTRLLNDLIED